MHTYIRRQRHLVFVVRVVVSCALSNFYLQVLFHVCCALSRFSPLSFALHLYLLLQLLVCRIISVFLSEDFSFARFVGIYLGLSFPSSLSLSISLSPPPLSFSPHCLRHSFPFAASLPSCCLTQAAQLFDHWFPPAPPGPTRLFHHLGFRRGTLDSLSLSLCCAKSLLHSCNFYHTHSCLFILPSLLPTLLPGYSSARHPSSGHSPTPGAALCSCHPKHSVHSLSSPCVATPGLSTPKWACLLNVASDSMKNGHMDVSTWANAGACRRTCAHVHACTHAHPGLRRHC